MTNWTMKQKPDNGLMSSFPSNAVKKYLGIQDGFPSGDPARWLLDSYQLTGINWPNSYGDYSFIVMPASKALENLIFKFATDLGIEVNTDKVGVIRDQVESQLSSALDQVEKKVGESIRVDVTYLKNFIQEYRHDIVHCKKRIETAELARRKVIVIFERMNSVTEKLIHANLVK